MTPIQLAVDAGNLVRDHRGMGRLARAFLREAAEEPAVAITLLAATGRDRRALRSEFPWARVAATGSARRIGRYDVVFFPFNGVRYPSSAPSLVLLHDVFAFTDPHRERIARHREQAPISRAARTAARIVTTTEWNRREIERELAIDPERIEVVPPTPDPFFVPGHPAALGPELGRDRFVLAVGGAERRKNLSMLLEACALAFAGTTHRIVIVGSMNDADRARTAKLRLPAFNVDASDFLLRTLYRSASVVAVPSRAEGFGLVAVEAMACGAAVLAGDAAGLPEATRGAAALLPPGNMRLWAGAIRTLLDDETRRAELAARGARAFAFGDRNAHARALLAALRRLAREGR